MPFNGSEGRPIDPNKAAQWTANYREANPGAVQSHFMGRDVLFSLLNQGGSEGIRFYYGLNGTVPQLIAVGADAAENDQLGDGYLVADEGMTGPPRSGQPSILNS